MGQVCEECGPWLGLSKVHEAQEEDVERLQREKAALVLENKELVEASFNQAKTIEELKQALGDLMVENEIPASDYLKELLG